MEFRRPISRQDKLSRPQTFNNRNGLNSKTPDPRTQAKQDVQQFLFKFKKQFAQQSNRFSNQKDKQHQKIPRLAVSFCEHKAKRHEHPSFLQKFVQGLQSYKGGDIHKTSARLLPDSLSIDLQNSLEQYPAPIRYGGAYDKVNENIDYAKNLLALYKSNYATSIGNDSIQYVQEVFESNSTCQVLKVMEKRTYELDQVLLYIENSLRAELCERSELLQEARQEICSTVKVALGLSRFCDQKRNSYEAQINNLTNLNYNLINSIQALKSIYEPSINEHSKLYRIDINTQPLEQLAIAKLQLDNDNLHIINSLHSTFKDLHQTLNSVKSKLLTKKKDYEGLKKKLVELQETYYLERTRRVKQRQSIVSNINFNA